MFSKRTLKIFLSSMTVLSLAGCSEFLNGKKAEPEVIEFSDSKLACLKVIPDQLKKFSVGEAKEEEIRGGFDCMGEALRYFNKRTFGSVQNGYTVEEMRRFFGKYFLKENNVSPEFAAELMKIKKVLVGGATTHITKDEVQRLVDLLEVVRDEAVELAPHVRVLLNAKDQQRAEWDTITAAITQLRRSSDRLIEKTQIVKAEYGFEDAKKALTGFADFIRGDVPFAPYDIYSNWVPVVEAVKNVLMGRRAHFTDIYQWKEGVGSFIDLYELALKYHYSLADLKFDSPAKVRQVSQFANQALMLLMNTHQMKTVGYISVEDIDVLIEVLLPKFTDSLRVNSLKKSYRLILMKMLDPERTRDVRSLVGLERKHLITLQRELNVWRLQQSFIDHLPFGEDGKISTATLLAEYDSFKKTFVIEKGLSDDVFEQRALESAWSDLGILLKNSIPVSFNGDGRLNILGHTSEASHSWKTLLKANLTRALARMLLLGYADQVPSVLAEAKMSKKQLVSWYDDFQEFGLDLHIFDPRSANSGERSFLEANFFTFSGDGNDWMDFRETYEFVSTLVAAGLSSSDSLRLHMEQAHCAIDKKDVFGNYFLKEDCFKEQLKKHIHVYFNNMPGLVRYLQGLNNKDWDSFYQYLAVSSVTEDQKTGLIETANIRTMVMILHYVEGVMAVYDLDSSGGLSLGEVYKAAPRFTPFFRTVVSTKSETLLTEGFAHLVFYGKIPGVVDLTAFQWGKMIGLSEAQRMDIVRLFGTLKDQLNKPTN